jgi:hypothetical protein
MLALRFFFERLYLPTILNFGLGKSGGFPLSKSQKYAP